MSSSDSFKLCETIFADRFRVERVVGEGGCAVVYAARHLGLDTKIALKVMKPDVVEPARRPTFDAMFMAESRTLAKLKHPAIVQVLDCGTSPLPTGEPTPWMALEWLEGHTLEEWLKDRRGHGGMSPADALALLRPAIEAVAFAHKAGYAHRDLKPANLMMVVGDGPRLRVMDFGIAKAVEGDDLAPSSGHTKTRSTVAGFSPPYAAPEQLARMRTGPWTDVHALALMLVELLLDRPAYRARSPKDLFEQIVSSQRPSPAQLGFDVGAWEPILASALAWTPEARPQSAQALLDALVFALPQARGVATAPVLAPTPSLASPTVLVAPETQLVPSAQTTLQGAVFAHTVQTSVHADPPAPRGSARGPIAAGLGVLLVAGAGAAWVATQPHAAPQHSATQSAAPAMPTVAPSLARVVPAPRGSVLPAPVRPSVVPVQAPAPIGSATTLAAPVAQPRASAAAVASRGLGTVNVLVEPWGEVSIDGVARGRAPVRVQVAPGTHTIRVTGGVSQTQQVDVTAGATRTVAIGRPALD